MRMARLPQHLAVFLLAVVHLLLFSIGPVSSRIYRTKDAVVMEVDDTLRARNLEDQPLTRFARSNLGNAPAIPLTSAGSVSDAENVRATSSPESRQSTGCGVGPFALPRLNNNPEDRIVGGSLPNQKNAWPFVVGLKRTTSYPVFCGGSIISPSKILTAASCVERASLDEIAKMTVRLGMNTQGDGKTIQHDAQMTRAVTRAVYHIDYNRKTQQNDVAILTVDPPIIYSSAISPVCLPAASSAADQYTGKNAAIMGWGRVNAGGGLSSDLLQAKVKIMANARCKNVWTDAADIFTQQLCASGDGIDICKNDMGGPMVAQLTPASNVWTQIGISSFSDDCLADKPAVFASVAFFRNWINTNLNS